MSEYNPDYVSPEDLPEAPDTTQFFRELATSSNELSETLRPLAEHQYDAERLSGEFHTIPDFLLPFIPADSTGAVISLSFSEAPGGAFQINKVRAELNDGPILDIRTDGPFSILTVSDDHENEMMFPGATACEDVLRSLTPEIEGEPEPDLRLIAQAFYLRSPQSAHHMTVTHAGNTFRHLEVTNATEKRDCTIVTNEVADPIGSVAVSAMIRKTSDTFNGASRMRYDVDMVYATPDEATLEQVVARPTIHVETPAEFHTAALEDGVETLLDERFGAQGNHDLVG